MYRVFFIIAYNAVKSINKTFIPLTQPFFFIPASTIITNQTYGQKRIFIAFRFWLRINCIGFVSWRLLKKCQFRHGVSFRRRFYFGLSQSVNAALLTNGGYVYNSGVIVAKTMAGAYIAVQQVCTHESVTITYQGSNHRFYCDGHGATFSESGAVTGGPAPRALQMYNTSLTANSLRVYS